MAKRQTDTDKWEGEFMRGLPPEYRMLWLYINDACDYAGIWRVDKELATVFTGMKFEVSKAIELFNGKIDVCDGGKKWVIVGFIELQYGEKNKNGKIARAAMDKRNEVLMKIDDKGGILLPLIDTEKVETEKRQKKGVSLFPESTNSMSPELLAAWTKWVKYRKERGKPYGTESGVNSAIRKLLGASTQAAVEAIETAIANEWQGFFIGKTDKTDKNGKEKRKSENRGTDGRIPKGKHGFGTL